MLNADELKQKLIQYRISENEYQLIKNQLGREPEGVEWALYSALWSEHCSYKSSKVHLKKLYNQSPRLVQGFGENAGVIDLGQGEKVAFKMESHNHPSFIEPFQGAATGVGGILRDIFTMGARPIALANYLCFGEPNADRMPQLVKGVVSGISFYGNCVGVPMLTGQTHFHSRYNKNILVNAFALGYFGKQDKVMTAKASGVGNRVVYVGAKTGRDGVHGASMASESFDKDSESKRPTIQIGDPFYEKLLIESCLEVIQKNLVVAIQDMGAAGLTSSSFEMAASGGVGLNLNLDAVPLRDKTLSPEDILLSESQERMLLICEPDKLQPIQAVFSQWGLDAVEIGEVVSNPEITLYWKGEILTSIDPQTIVENSPCYERDFQSYVNPYKVKILEKVKKCKTWEEQLEKVFSSESLVSRRWLYEQYDNRVGARTEFGCEETIGVVRLPESKRPLGVCLGGRPVVMNLDAEVGGGDSVAYPSLKLALKGFEPLAVTDCLNYGNPEKKPVMTEFVSSLNKLNEICEVLQAPIISGNVSLYNETESVNIISTPATAVVGLRESKENVTTSYFSNANEDIFLLDFSMVESFAYLNHVYDESYQIKGDLCAKKVKHAVDLLLKLNEFKNITSSRMVGQFGLLPTLVKMTIKKQLGFHFDLEFDDFRDLFKDHFYQAIVTTNESESFLQFLNSIDHGEIKIYRVGSTVKANTITVNGSHSDLTSLLNNYTKGLPGVVYGL